VAHVRLEIATNHQGRGDTAEWQPGDCAFWRTAQLQNGRCTVRLEYVRTGLHGVQALARP
jgi:hypothetical protein